MLTSLLALAQQRGAPANEALPAADMPIQRGEVTATVRVAADPNQSYALYLPSNYTAQRAWPIVYVFDPGGRGVNPLNLMKDAAEKYGYILAASNNARNGPLKPQAEAAQAIWQDTHARMAIDDQQIAFAGHSGGARLAAWVAQQCKCAAGLLLNGAGYPVAFPPTRDGAIPVFAAVGMLDFNYGEMVQLDARLESLKYPHFLRRWDGPHAWGPAEVWQEAFAWLELSAMKQGRRPVDASFVAGELASASARAGKAEQTDSTYFAWQNYRQTAAIFSGLGDASALSERAAALANLPAVRSGQSDEKKEMEQRQSILADVIRLAREGGDAAGDFGAGDFSGATRSAGGNFETVKMQALRKIRRLRDELAKEKQPERLRALQRTQAGIALFMTDAGNALMGAKQYPAARVQFELAVAAQPERARPSIALARSLLAMGDEAEALHVLQGARAAGVSAAELRDGTRLLAEFEALNGDDKFQQLLRSERFPATSADANAVFSLRISAPETFNVGDPIKVHVVLTNASSEKLVVMKARGEGREMERFDVEIGDELGQLVSSEKYEHFRKLPCFLGEIPSASVVCVGSDVAVPIDPGKSFQDDLLISRYFDLNRPGKYSIKVSRTENVSPERQIRSESNIITITCERK